MIECKFITNGIAIDTEQKIRPCCTFQPSDGFFERNLFSNDVNLDRWHQTDPDIVAAKSLLQHGKWPKSCKRCYDIEKTGRQDSVRLNGNHAYKDYSEDSITLEIRPGATCNFACQTCWPAASSRVIDFYKKAGLLTPVMPAYPEVDYSKLESIKHRIKDVVILGGEPFYDKNCRKFLEWALENLSAKILIFTNGSVIDFEFLKAYSGDLTLIFSLDAIGRPSEYIRFGSTWETVKQNFEKCLKLGIAEVRVNITTSVFNYSYLPNLLAFLFDQKPDLITFGVAFEYHEGIIPIKNRLTLITKLSTCFSMIDNSYMSKDQKANANSAIRAIIKNLETEPWDKDQYQTFVEKFNKLNKVKNVKMVDFCPETAQLLEM